MSYVFQPYPLIRQSFFQKLLGQHPRENAIIEVNNLLAAKPVDRVTQAHITAIEKKYRTNIKKQFQLNLEEFYAVYLNHCLQDRTLDDGEVSELEHLKNIFALPDKAVTYLHEQISSLVYRDCYKQAVADGHLTSDEKSLLVQLENELKLPAALAEKIAKEVCEQFFSDHLDNLINSADFSPTDEKELDAIARSLTIDTALKDRKKQQLEQLKTYWALENLPLAEYPSEQPLQKGEVCYFKIEDVSWHELRGSQKLDVHPAGLTHKRFFLQEPSKQKGADNSVLRFVDQGTVYLTNKRILFIGPLKNSTIRLDGIQSTTPYKDAVHILKEKGKNPLLHFAKKADVFSLILQRLTTDIRK